MLKDDAATANIPVILMTAVAEPHKLSPGGWISFPSKPFSAKELREAIVSATKTG